MRHFQSMPLLETEQTESWTKVECDTTYTEWDLEIYTVLI